MRTGHDEKSGKKTFHDIPSYTSFFNYMTVLLIQKLKKKRNSSLIHYKEAERKKENIKKASFLDS